jgi:hypothetical protein
MKTLKYRFTPLVLILFSFFLAHRCVAIPPQVPQPSSSKQQGETREGEQRLPTNRDRCHHPPEDISPREARAVLRQMRVRAMLSAEDERLILKFLAP